MPLPTNPSRPGDGGAFPPPWDYLIEAFEVLWSLWKAHALDLGFLERVALIPAALAGAAVLRTISFTLSHARRLFEALRHRRTAFQAA